MQTMRLAQKQNEKGLFIVISRLTFPDASFEIKQHLQSGESLFFANSSKPELACDGSFMQIRSVGCAGV